MKGLNKILLIFVFAIFTLSFLGCNQDSFKPTGDNVGSFSSYAELKSYLKNNLDYQTDKIYYEGAFLEDVSDSVVNQPASDDTSEERDYSKTNNQVEGVDEGDQILTDGYNIYIISGDKFFIINADNLDIEYTQTIENGSFSNMYLYQDKIVLISHTYSYTVEICEYPYYVDENYKSEGDVSIDTNDSTEIYTYTCNRYKHGTTVQILDVSNVNDVTLDRELYFDSAYIISSRMIDQQLYLILNNNMYRYYFDDEDFIPKYRDSLVSDELIFLPANRIFFMPNDGQDFGFLTLVSIDVTTDEEVNIKAYLGSTWNIYMSLNNLYTIVNKWSYDEDTDWYSHYTFVLRFEIENNELVYKAIGRIDGTPINQFAMDEYDGVFRIATTGYKYTSDSWRIDNYMFLLDAQTDDEMTELSKMSDLGKPGERIYSVRFEQELAYVVTFEQIDPLYKIDLSNPNKPVVLGQLEEEGVSDYLHVITDNLMIGVGRQAETIDDFTRFTGVKVALYDTTNDNVVNLDTYLIEGQYSFTNVMWDHKVFLTFTPQGADFTYVGIPVYELYDDYYGYSQSLYLFKVYHSGALELVTKLTHMVEDTEGYYRYFDTIERAVIIENNVYTLSFSSIRMFNIDDDFALVTETELNSSYYDSWIYPEEAID